MQKQPHALRPRPCLDLAAIASGATVARTPPDKPGSLKDSYKTIDIRPKDPDRQKRGSQMEAYMSGRVLSGSEASCAAPRSF